MRTPFVLIQDGVANTIKALRDLTASMASDNNGPWQHAVLILVPLWGVQLILPDLFLLGIPFVAMSRNFSRVPPSHWDAHVWLIMAFSLLCIIMTSTEIYLFMKRRLSTRAYLISMWVKASLIVFCWGLISIFNWSGVPRTFPLGLYSDENFLLQHPAILIALYYAIKKYSTHGGESGSMAPTSTIDRAETEPLLTTISEDV